MRGKGLKLRVVGDIEYGVAFQKDNFSWGSLGVYKGDRSFLIPVEDRYGIGIVFSDRIIVLNATLGEISDFYLDLNQLLGRRNSDKGSGGKSEGEELKETYYQLEVKKNYDFFKEDDRVEVKNFYRILAERGRYCEKDGEVIVFHPLFYSVNADKETYLIKVLQKEKEYLKLKAAQVVRRSGLPQRSPNKIVLAPPREPLNVRVECPSCEWQFLDFYVSYLSGDYYVRDPISEPIEPILEAELGLPFFSTHFQYIPVHGFSASRGDKYIVFLSGKSRFDPSKTLTVFLAFTEDKDLELKLPKSWGPQLAFSKNIYPKIKGLNCQNPDLRAYVLSLSSSYMFLGELHFSEFYRIIISSGWLVGKKDYKIPDFSALFPSWLLPRAPSFGQKALLTAKALISQSELAEVVYLALPGRIIRFSFTGEAYLVGLEKKYTILWPFS